MAQSIRAYFSEKKNKDLVDKLDNILDIKSPEKSSHQPLAGISFVITGTLSAMSRDAAEEAVRRLGGSARSSVSAKTNYLVAGADPGGKLTKARDLGVKIITEDEFLQIIGET